MFKAIGNKGLSMFEGDYGERLEIKIIEGEILAGDELRFIIQDEQHNPFIDKVVEINSQNIVEFYLTQAETNKLKEGNYLWGLKQYRDGLLIDTLSGNNLFKVVKGQ